MYVKSEKNKFQGSMTSNDCYWRMSAFIALTLVAL